MAKNKVYIDVVVDDKGTTKRVAVNAKKLGSALEETAKSARTADRNLKGASQQSANGTKNFSKMAQGISGTLVPAYATLAANIFAITAAFAFLKESADFRVVQEAQVAFSSATGVGLKSLTADIKNATDGLVGFKDAASGAAIGVAAGLSTGQIEKFAKGAKDVSLILGRDVTDSFNRLIRGVTKAEPELLDELGIILRLETATEKYAAALNKNAKELTLFEKSQAVAAEVQEQLDQKYSTVAASVELQANAVAQLGIAFEEVIIPLREFISSLAEPTALFLKDNIKALTGVLVLFAVPLVKSIIPNLEEWGRTSREAAATASAAYENTKKEIDELRIAQEKLNKSSPLKGAQEALKGVDSKSAGVKAIQAGKFEQVTPRQVNSLLAAAERGKGAVTQMSNEMKVKYIAALREMKTSTDVQMGRVERTFRQTVNKIKLGAAKASAAWQLGMSKIKSASALAAKGIDKAFKAISLVGLALLIKDLGVSIAESFGLIGQDQAITDLSAKFEQLERDLSNTSKEFEKFAQIQSKFFEKNAGKVTLESVAALGGFASSAASSLSDVADSFAELNSLQQKGLDTQANFFAETILGYEDLEDAQKSLSEKATSTAALLVEGLKAAKVETQELGPEFLGLAEKIAQNGGITGLTSEELERFRELGTLFEKLQGKANTLIQNNIAINQEYDKTIQGLTQFDTKVGGIIRSIEAQIELEKEVNTENSERLAGYDKQLVVLKQIRDAEIKFANDQKRLEFARVKLLIGKTALQKEEIQRNLKLQDIEIKRQQLINDIAIAEAAGVEKDQAKIDNLNIQLGILNAQEESLIRQGDYAAQLADTLSQSFETSLQKGIADAIKGNETSFKDLMLNIAQSVLNAVADTLAKQITQSLFNIDSPEAKIKTAMTEAADYHGSVIRAAVEGAPAPTGTSTTSSGGNIGGTSQSVGIMEKLFGAPSQKNKTGAPTQTKISEVGIVSNRGGSVNRFLGDFAAIFDKNAEGGFVEKLGKAFASGGNIFTDIFSSLPQLFSNILGGIGGGMSGIFGTVASLFFANGGIAKGGFRSAAYARGGIATQPTVGLVGEGRYNEAIVPLPDGKSIPVTMSGMGQQNNVTVNVNIDGNGNATQDEQGSGGTDIGRAVAAAVQAELMNQKRSGGILSPYGAS